MKKFAILGLTLIFLLALIACSANNSAEVKPAVEPKAEAEVVEPKAEAEPAVVEPVVEPKEQPTAVEPGTVEPKEQTPVVEPKEPAVVEPTPVVATPKTHKVDIENFAFSPVTLEISVGDIVEFTNLDTVKHSAVEDNGVFDTGLLGKDESKQITFNEAGEFAYHCGPHPGMKANIIVK